MMLKSFLLLVVPSLFCNAQNFPYPRHPDEILREVAEPSAAAVARRALRGLSISEVIKGVYPTLPTRPGKTSGERSEPRPEQVPVPEALRRDAPADSQAQSPAQPITSPPEAPVRNEPEAAPEIRFLPGNQVQYPLGGLPIASPARDDGAVATGVQTAAPNRNVVDLNILPERYRASSVRPAANINVIPVSSSPRRLRADSGRSQAYNEAARPPLDSSDDYYESYEFGYEIRTPEGTHSHEERKIPTGQVFGSYSMVLADGRQRLVTYRADGQGFHPIVETNELGTLTSEPADAKIVSSATLPNGEQPAEPAVPTRAPRRIRKVRKTKAKKTST